MPWAPSYASAGELRDFVRIDDDADDVVIGVALDAASRAIDYACDPRPDMFRQFGRTDAPEDRFYTVELRGYDIPVRGQWVAPTDDIADPVGVVVAASDGNGAFVPVTGTTLRPRNATQVARPHVSVSFAGSSLPTPPTVAEAIKVTAVWGWPAVPTAIHQACLLQASRLLSRRDAPFGVAGSPEVGSEVRLLPKLDPDVEMITRPYLRKIGPVLA